MSIDEVVGLHEWVGAEVATTFFVVTGAQELFEMIGATLFLRAKLVELQRRSMVLDLRDAVADDTAVTGADTAPSERMVYDLSGGHR